MITAILERNLLPDSLIRSGIRRLLRQRLREEGAGSPEAQSARLMRFIDLLKASPIAQSTAEANQQHYEVPTDFYRPILGRHMKYSSGYWAPGVASIDDSETEMLSLCCERAQLVDGQSVLELGCGWGSLSLFMAQRYPKNRITGVSNSRTQKLYIDEQARARGLDNLEIVTADMNQFDHGNQFDRVVSVEMFEHMRNYEELMARIARWLKPAGKLFVHIFVHREFAYPFEVKDSSDWMAKYFFTGGIMPSDNLLLYFSRDLRIVRQWRVDGTHYQKTSEAWLRRMDSNRTTLYPIISQTYGVENAETWWVYWRVFFMSCAELWGFRGGSEWFVSHYLFEKR